jgi:hypothetical protein
MSIAPIPILDFLVKATPRFKRPKHLAEAAELLERVLRGESVHAVLCAAVRHGKTELLKAFVVLYLLLYPQKRVVWATYQIKFGEKISRQIRDLYLQCGGSVAPDANSKSDWRTGVDDGGLKVTSPDGPITGEGLDLAIVDDAHNPRLVEVGLLHARGAGRELHRVRRSVAS